MAQGDEKRRLFEAFIVLIVQFLSPQNGRPLQIGGRIKNKMSAGGASQLVLSNTVTQDSGIYQCQAENRAGLVSAAARLLVNITGRRPEPPSRLRAVPLSASDVVLSWDPPRNVPLDDVTAYTVHYTLLGRAGDETQELALNSSHHVRQLVRNANYSFYVRAYIRRSASDPSERFVFNAAQALAQPPTPAPAAPSRPPAKTLPPPSGAAAPSVTLQPLSPTTLRVAWNRFPSPVSLYKILFRRHNKKEFDIEVVKGIHSISRLDFPLHTDTDLCFQATFSSTTSPDCTRAGGTT